jgi:P27 family predicted phage terminase small subunit
MGRKATPTRLKVLAGNPGHKPLNKDEPQAAASRLKVPAFLKGDQVATKEFKRLGKLLVDAGIMTVLDEDALGVYAASYSRWVAESKLLKDEGTMLKSTKGNSYVNPRLWVVDAARDSMNKALSEFGMTPSARSKLKTAPQAGGPGRGLVDTVCAGAADVVAQAKAWEPPADADTVGEVG